MRALWDNPKGDCLVEVIFFREELFRKTLSGTKVHFRAVNRPGLQRDVLLHILSGGVLVDSEYGVAYRFGEMKWEELRVEVIPIEKDN